MCSGLGSLGCWHADKMSSSVAALMVDLSTKIMLTILWTYHIGNYLKPCVIWLDKTDRVRPDDKALRLEP